MIQEIRQVSQAKAQKREIALSTGVVWGLLGGLAGTIVLDLAQVGTALALGYDADLTYYVSGYTAASFFTSLGINVTGDALLGVIIRYAIGLGLGALFGAVVSRVEALRLDAAKRVMFSMLYIGVMSQPLLAAAPISLRTQWSVDETWEWFVASFFIHLLYSVTLAVVVGYGLRRSKGVA